MADKNTTTVSFTTKPKFEKVEIVGKTILSKDFAGTVDREPMTRAYITLDAGFDGSQVIVDGADEYGIRSVKEADITVSISFPNDEKKHVAASWTLHGYKAESVENPGCIDFFVDKKNADKLTACAPEDGKPAGLLYTLRLMIAQHPEWANLWKIVDVSNDSRVFIRAIESIDSHGNVIE